MIRLRWVRGYGLFSWLIAWFSAGHLSHVDAVMPDGTLMGARFDNVGGGRGVRRRPNPYEQVAQILLMDLPATPEQVRAFYDFIARQEGKPYDWLAIFAFLVNRNWRDLDAWYCAEVIAEGLIEAKWLPRGLFLTANKITPVMLAFAVQQQIASLPR